MSPVYFVKDVSGTTKIQLKGRLTIDKKYLDKDIYISWPSAGSFYLIMHSKLIELLGRTTDWLESDSWISHGGYSSKGPNKKTVEALKPYLL